MISQTCFENKFYLCEFGKECTEGRKRRNCATDFIKTLPKYKVNILKRDCKKEGFVFAGIENHIVMLNKDAVEIADEDGKTAILSKFMKEKLVPFPFTEKRRFEYFNLRSSELGQSCPLEGIQAKLGDEAKKGFKENIYARAGTMMHLFSNTQPKGKSYAHNQTLSQIGIKPMRREEYCEKEVEYQSKEGIIVRGHLDTSLISGDVLCVLDFKRMFIIPHEKISYRLQLASYKKGIEQTIGREFDRSLLITIRRPFPPSILGKERFEVRGKSRAQKPKITYFSNEDELNRTLDEKISKIAENQAFYLNNPEKIVKAIELKENSVGEGFCIRKNGLKCFSYDICQYLKDYISDGGDIWKLMMGGFKPVK